jgi:hypothetical protein
MLVTSEIGGVPTYAWDRLVYSFICIHNLCLWRAFGRNVKSTVNNNLSRQNEWHLILFHLRKDPTAAMNFYITDEIRVNKITRHKEMVLRIFWLTTHITKFTFTSKQLIYRSIFFFHTHKEWKQMMAINEQYYGDNGKSNSLRQAVKFLSLKVCTFQP